MHTTTIKNCSEKIKLRQEISKNASKTGLKMFPSRKLLCLTDGEIILSGCANNGSHNSQQGGVSLLHSGLRNILCFSVRRWTVNICTSQNYLSCHKHRVGTTLHTTKPHKAHTAPCIYSPWLQSFFFSPVPSHICFLYQPVVFLQMLRLRELQRSGLPFSHLETLGLAPKSLDPGFSTAFTRHCSSQK